MIRLSVITASISRKAGGLFASVRKLTQAATTVRLCDAQVFGFEDEYTVEDRLAWLPLEPHVFARCGPSFFPTSRFMKHAVLAVSPDILHCHGIWLYPSLVDLAAKRENKTPYVVSPRGMLDPWALANSHQKKRIAGWLFENRHLRGAACIHALCDSEYQSIRAYGLKNPVCIIPNGVDLPSPTDTQASPPWEPRVDGDKHVMLFLGRIHPKKGLENLIRAWGILKSRKHRELEQWHLAIAGWSQGGHENELKRLADELNLGTDVTFTGPLYDDAKDAALRAARAFILPSFSEGLPMAVLEAWAYGLPVIMTRECNIPDGFEAGAALDVRPDVESITEGLKSFVALSGGARERMGRNGLELVKSRYSWPKIAARMIDVYEWVLGEGRKTNCVKLD